MHEGNVQERQQAKFLRASRENEHAVTQHNGSPASRTMFNNHRRMRILREENDRALAGLGRGDTERIVGAMRALPEVYRLVTTLYFVDDLAYEEIASTLGIAIGTVRSQLHRGQRMLMASLGSLAGDHGIGARSTGTRPGIPLRRRATQGS